MALLDEIAPYTKSPDRLQSFANAVRRIDQNKIDGDIVECGVWRGGNIILARKLSPERTCWLFDTFEGMTEPTELDVTRGGKPAIRSYKKKQDWGAKWARASVEEVITGMTAMGVMDATKLVFIKGDVSQTLLDPVFVPRKIALLRLDTDWHASTKVELEVLYPRLEIGGILIVDDYGHWRGARKAVDDYFCGSVKIEMLDYTAAQIIKC